MCSRKFTQGRGGFALSSHAFAKGLRKFCDGFAMGSRKFAQGLDGFAQLPPTSKTTNKQIRAQTCRNSSSTSQVLRNRCFIRSPCQNAKRHTSFSRSKLAASHDKTVLNQAAASPSRGAHPAMEMR
eukprot:4521222-Prymnesium_polylepis.1